MYLLSIYVVLVLKFSVSSWYRLNHKLNSVGKVSVLVCFEVNMIFVLKNPDLIPPNKPNSVRIFDVFWVEEQ